MSANQASRHSWGTLMESLCQASKIVLCRRSAIGLEASFQTILGAYCPGSDLYDGSLARAWAKRSASRARVPGYLSSIGKLLV